MSEVAKKDNTGILCFIQNNSLKCYKTKESVSVSDCMKCEFNNGFRKRTHPNYSDHTFCIYQSDEEKRYDESLRNMKCPTCNSDLVDNTIKEGSHKGHGNIYCPKCQKNLIWI